MFQSLLQKWAYKCINYIKHMCMCKVFNPFSALITELFRIGINSYRNCQLHIQYSLDFYCVFWGKNGIILIGIYFHNICPVIWYWNIFKNMRPCINITFFTIKPKQFFICRMNQTVITSPTTYNILVINVALLIRSCIINMYISCRMA